MRVFHSRLHEQPNRGIIPQFTMIVYTTTHLGHILPDVYGHTWSADVEHRFHVSTTAVKISSYQQKRNGSGYFARQAGRGRTPDRRGIGG